MPRPNVLALSAIAASAIAAPASGPCDILAAGKTPCVAAHSSTRTLFSRYKGPLYQVLRNADGKTRDIPQLAANGVADAAVQDSFCAKSTCVISLIYDQSGNNNHLAPAPGGQFSGPLVGGGDESAGATSAPVTLNGYKAYGIFISPGTGYRNDTTVGIPIGAQPQGIYAVLDGTHYNDGCCFDYGNAETSNTNTGNGHMQSVYFGNNEVWGTGADSGPWIMADLENGLFSQGSIGSNPKNPSLHHRFVSAFVKSSTKTFTIRGGNSQSGKLKTYYSGPFPSGYTPMQKEGAILLGIGGDNSNGAQGTFYEGVITAKMPEKKVENAVQQNIIAAKYAVTSEVSGPAVNVSSTITIGVTSSGSKSRYVVHSGSNIITEVINAGNSSAEKAAGKWKVIKGLGNSGCVTFESVDQPGKYIRHYGFQLFLNSNDGTSLFADDATFCPEKGLSGKGNSLRSWSYPARFFRHYSNTLYIASQGGPESFDNPQKYTDDATFLIGEGF